MSTKYINCFIAKREQKHFCKGDVVAIINHEIVDSPAGLTNYHKYAILVEVDIFKRENGKMIRYNRFKQHHNTTIFANFFLSLERMTKEEEKEFLKEEKVYLTILEK
jgi:hypothetical protein